MRIAFGLETESQLGGLTSDLLDGGYYLMTPADGKSQPIEISTEYGQQPALRTHVVEVHEDGTFVDRGVFLMFWKSVYRTITANWDNHKAATLGTIRKVEQANDPTRHVHVVESPPESLRPGLLGAATAYEEALVSNTQNGVF